MLEQEISADMPDYDLLPDGRAFRFWQDGTDYRRVYYVAGNAPHASDDNPGTAGRPFRTISKAAEVLNPGEKVLIDSGVYEEFVRPARGGQGPDAMICYEAMPGAEVILTGLRKWEATFVPSVGWNTRMFPPNGDGGAPARAAIWTAALPAGAFLLANPFAMTNLPAQRFAGCGFLFHKMPKEADYRPFIMRRGMLFCGGRQLKQVNAFYELAGCPGSFWVEDNGLDIHVRLWDDGDPNALEFGFTCCEQLFAPKEPYMGYICVKGLTFEYVGNGFPGAQRGALSTYCGHHWIIEGNVIRWCNSIGLDMGHENPMRYSDNPSGGHIIRNNRVSHCGICGICGLPASRDGMRDLLVERNTVEDCCWHDAEFLYECAAIKIHGMRDSLVRHNLVRGTGFGSGIWADFGNSNMRIAGNVVLDTRYTIFGAIFVEGSQTVNLVDHNVVWKVGANPLGDLPQRTGSGGHGLYEHDCDNLRLTHNFVYGAAGSGVFLNYGDPIRNVMGRGPLGMKHRLTGNIIGNCAAAVVMPNEKNFSDENIYGSFAEAGPFRIRRVNTVYEWIHFSAWQEFHEWDVHGAECAMEASLDEAGMTLAVTLEAGGARETHVIDLKRPLDFSGIYRQFQMRPHAAAGKGDGL